MTTIPDEHEGTPNGAVVSVPSCAPCCNVLVVAAVARRILMPRITRTTRITSAVSLATVAIVMTCAGALPAQIIDRVLAVVGRSQLRFRTSPRRYGLDLFRAPGGRDRVRAALNALIERQLQLIEVNRYLPPEPPAAEIDARLAPIQARFASQAAFEKAMKETGVTLASCAPESATTCASRATSVSALARPISQARTKSLVTTRRTNPTSCGMARFGRMSEVRDEARTRLARRADGRARPGLGCRAAPSRRCHNPT